MTHTERFEQMVAAKRAREAANPTVSWRTVDEKFGGGYSGLGSNGVRVYVVWVGPANRKGTWEYGVRNGKVNEKRGTRRLLLEARAQAEKIVHQASQKPNGGSQ